VDLDDEVMAMNTGSIVRLNSGGSLMTVTGTEFGAGGDNVLCAWLDVNDGLQRGKFPIQCVKVEHERKPADVTAISKP
jgi:uncharacterized protein YodC (DUF2158 family)